MKMTRQPLILAAALVAVLALSACGKHDESTAPAPSATPPAAATAPAPAAPAPASTAPMAMNNAPAGVTFSSVELGSTVDANNKILASGTSFAPKDSIYASVDTSGSGNATLAAKWTYQDGQVVHEDSKALNAMGPETTAFMISKPGGFPAGNYKVDISLNGNQVASKDFSVK
ncbi:MULTISPECIES: hypothetical protein [unclassified Rhodanobacter]|uniref:hypothetical protein n=1 Tax=unclassified Rhodanobacter TaxID=2621553 RepID=UPI001BDDCEF2|nr:MULTISPECIES: hypothetical protein [unclassified Rhodanobacter]MBT2144291.1 hypothetical protein [Rhodanobacter sp. LX-99]MBT2150042.1 hypothetical protein [Rhodanobacter sp. LX-100]